MRRQLTLALFLVAPLVAQKDCTRSSFGLTPLPDLAGGSYRGRDGGLYPGGTNAIPPAHLAAGLIRAGEITPRDLAGAPAVDGRVVLLSIGMSNTTQEFSTFVPWSNADVERDALVRVVDGAQGGQDARIFANPNAAAWTVIDQRLANAGLTPQQVQALWLKEALAAPTSLQWPAHVDELATLLVDVIHNAQARYPNLKVAFLSSRTYGGYSPNPGRTEPLSYETGFSIKAVIGSQIAGNPLLNHDPALGAVRSPWLAWGPYLWADGIVPRSDGLRWLCDDTVADGVHPSLSGRLHVADLLMAHFRRHPASVGWYLDAPRTPWAATIAYGSPCAGSRGEPTIGARNLPVLGNANFGIQLGNALQNAPATLLLSLARSRVPLGRASCYLWLDPTLLIDAIAATTSATGLAAWTAAIPGDPALAGLAFEGQWVVLDAAGAPVPGVGGVAATAGLWTRVGVR